MQREFATLKAQKAELDNKLQVVYTFCNEYQPVENPEEDDAVDMKTTALCAVLLAAGATLPSGAQAQNIPLFTNGFPYVLGGMNAQNAYGYPGDRGQTSGAFVSGSVGVSAGYRRPYHRPRRYGGEVVFNEPGGGVHVPATRTTHTTPGTHRCYISPARDPRAKRPDRYGNNADCDD